MTIRRFFTQRGPAARVLTSAVVAVALLVTLTWALWSSPTRTVDTALVASTTDCKDMVTLSIAGRGDTPRPGTTKMLVDENGNELPAASADDYVSTWIDQASSAPLAEVGRDSYAAMYIAYPADMSSYEDAVNTGVANTEAVMEAIRVSCPDTQFAIVGYSEGADVARRVAMNVGHQEPNEDGTYGIVDPTNVVGVVILADAGRVDGQGPFPGAENPFTNPDGFDLEYQDGTAAVPGQGALPDTGGDDFGALNGRIASFCADGDLTCAAPENISLLQLVVNVGRQLDVDALEREQLTPATGIDVATVMSRIALDAFADIRSQPDWIRSDETFLEVLLKVSDPSYDGPTAAPATPETDASDISDMTAVSGEQDSISTEEMSPLAYLPQKLFKEIVGLIVTNQNTIPVIMSDPYQLTLGPEIGHHFDYWRDADPENGKDLTSADYAAAWLTYLAQQAQAGEPVDPKATPSAAELSAALEELVLEEAVTTLSEGAAPSLAATPSGAVQPAETTPAPTLPTTTPGAAPTTTPAPSDAAETATAEPTQTAVTPETTATPTTSTPAETTVASEATTPVTAPVPTPAG
ncbi:cutinase family protein [Rhodococcus xishaensis]|uniref:Cutinase family protein n=1 Tax=Rhodococcus xishaensis TaxID=2487364 RepID=A0A438ATB5_9NOCA|nr:cutinase family protein [Rhodococcus xishaensis]RVW01974.1 cutinase family protein [Rhodococcus xishaensis]